MAVVEYENAASAQDALKRVAYKRIGNSVVYLERAPLGIWDPEKAAKAKAVAGAVVAVAKSGVVPVRISDETEAGAGAGEDEIDETVPPPGATLFVKNLSFSTDNDKFTRTFRSLPSFAFARIQMKPDPKRPGERLSMGYGFVGFKTPEAAKSAMKGMQGFVLDGHQLVVKYAQRGAEEDVAKGGASKGTTTKIIMKNVPFEATKKDIRELFSYVIVYFLRPISWFSFPPSSSM